MVVINDKQRMPATVIRERELLDERDRGRTHHSNQNFWIFGIVSSMFPYLYIIIWTQHNNQPTLAGKIVRSIFLGESIPKIPEREDGHNIYVATNQLWGTKLCFRSFWECFVME